MSSAEKICEHVNENSKDQSVNIFVGQTTVWARLIGRGFKEAN